MSESYLAEKLNDAQHLIEDLRAQILALTVERDHHKFHAENNAALRHRALADRDAMKAERDKLREERDMKEQAHGSLLTQYKQILQSLDAANARADAAEKKLLDGNQT